MKDFWIEKAREQSVYDRFWASKAGKKPTPFPANLVLEGQSNSLDDLIASVDRGLLVTGLVHTSRPTEDVQLTGLTAMVCF